MRHKLTICSTCLKDGEDTPKGAAMADALRVMLATDGFKDFVVETVECMNACSNPTAISFRAPNKAAYMFAGVDPQRDHADIIAFARLYSETSDGMIEDATPCGRLRHLLIGRIPA